MKNLYNQLLMVGIIVFSITTLLSINKLNNYSETIEILLEKLDDKQQELDSINSLEFLYVTGTYYNPCPKQTNEDFLHTANMSKIDTVALNNYELRWLAISRDLLEYYQFEDTVFIHSENSSINGQWIIKDLMNQRWYRRIDFLVPFNDTLNIGKTPLKITKYGNK